jgi:hypothetical protein
LHHKDGNKDNFVLDNLQMLCYNHFYLFQGDIFNKQDIIKLETHMPVSGTSDAIDWQLDEYQLEQMAKLGLYEPPKAEDDGSDLISRL